MDINPKILNALEPVAPELELCRESSNSQWVKRGIDLTIRTFQESKGLTGIKFGGFNKLVSGKNLLQGKVDYPLMDVMLSFRQFRSRAWL